MKITKVFFFANGALACFEGDAPVPERSGNLLCDWIRERRAAGEIADDAEILRQLPGGAAPSEKASDCYAHD